MILRVALFSLVIISILVPEPVQVVDSSYANHATSQVEEIEIIEDKIGDKGTDEREVSDDTDFLLEAESLSNENHVSVVAEAVTSSSQDDAPKKSYASILSSLTKKGPTKVYLPANTAKVPAKTEKQPLNQDAEASVPEPSVPVAPNNAPESKDAPDEGTFFFSCSYFPY